jgi:hypothetical protein
LFAPPPPPPLVPLVPVPAERKKQTGATSQSEASGGLPETSHSITSTEVPSNSDHRTYSGVRPSKPQHGKQTMNAQCTFNFKATY